MSMEESPPEGAEDHRIIAKIKRGFGDPSVVVTEPGPPILAGGTFAWDEDLLRVWYVSDGHNFAFATFVCATKFAGQELPDCEQIVRSISFASE